MRQGDTMDPGDVARDAGGELNLNTVEEDVLAKVPGIGPERAQKIVENRPFSDWADLKQKVGGVSDTLIEELKRAGATIG